MEYWKDLADELTLILNYAAVASRAVGAGHAASADLCELERSAHRCAAIVREALLRRVWGGTAHWSS